MQLIRNRVHVPNLPEVYAGSDMVVFGVSINSILLASNTECRLIHYRDNLIVKLLYWPVIMGSLLEVTLINFY